jgi:hypothetical protein
MDQETKVIEHLKLIQPIITRMNSSSFSIKGYSLIIFSAFIIYAFKEHCIPVYIVSYFLLFLLSLIDRFYLWQERLFKKLYDYISKQSTTDFSMNRDKQKKEIKYRKTFFSISIFPFYFALVLLNTLGLLLEVKL